MARHILLAFSGAKPGDGNAQALEEWYREVHLPEIAADPEVLSAKRYKVLGGLPEGVSCPYVSIYEMETDDMDALNARMAERLSPIHEALDRETTVNVLVVEETE